MHFEIATSHKDDSTLVIDEMLTAFRAASADGSTPDFIAIHGRHDLMTPALQLAAIKGFGDIPLHAASSFAGVISHRTVAEASLATCGAIAFFDPEGDFGTASADLGDDPMAAAQRATIAALENAGRRGEAPTIILLSSAPGSEEQVLEGIRSVVGDGTTVMGGSSADDDVSGKWTQFSHQCFHTNGVVISALFLSAPPFVGFQSGYSPVGHCGTITGVDGRKILSIDGERANQVYARWTGQTIPAPKGDDASRQIMEHSSLYPLGRVASHVNSVPFHVLLLPTHTNPDGSLDMFANAEPGETVYLMNGTKDNILHRVGSIGRMARGGVEKPKASLVIICAGCMIALGPRMHEISGALAAAFGDTPYLGIFAFGEQGTVANGKAEHGNLMISCAVFS